MAERDNTKWEVKWAIPQNNIKNEAGLKDTLNAMTEETDQGQGQQKKSSPRMEHCRRNSEKIKQA